MRFRDCLILIAVFCLASGTASAVSRELQYGPPAPWVVPTPSPTETAAPSGAPFRTVFSDSQVRLGAAEEEVYSAQRIKILSADGLAIGNVAVTWNSSTEDVTIHSLKIIREKQVIDVLTATKFQIIQREDNLDYAMLDGKLTATLQAPGLQIGDELEFILTTRRRDTVFGGRASGFMQMPVASSPGAYRVRFTWPEGKTVNWRVTPDLPKPVPVTRGGEKLLTYELRDPKLAVTAEGAPVRFNIRRTIEYSGFSSWSDISYVMWPLFHKASMLAPDSPVRQEAARIAASTSDPVARTEAALALVQEKIRYVYVGLDDGNYRPATADDTWSRRFGDCKAKTALLIALLRELGVPAEAVIVNASGGDGTDQRLPAPGLFDHVLVRASIGDKTYWLDGTRLGDRSLAVLPPPTFRWALPLRNGATALEPVPPQAPALPEYIDVLEIDATAGFDVPAKVFAERIFRGDGVFQMRTYLSGMAPEDAKRAQDAMWLESLTWAKPAEVSWRYDEPQGVIVMTMSGEGKLEWLGDALSGRLLDLFNASFTQPDPLRRPDEQDQTAPWETDFPAFNCWATTIRLPAASTRWQWTHNATPINRKVGGIAYWRQASIEDGNVRTVMSKRTYLREISPAQAQELNDKRTSFSKYVSRVFQIEAGNPLLNTPVSSLRSGKAPIDWSGPDVPCSAAEEPPAEAEVAPAPVKIAESAKPKPPPPRGDTTEPRQNPDFPVTQPPYPAQSVYAREEGAVIMSFVVRADGTVDAGTIRVFESSGFGALDAAAMAEAATWRFLPATRNGKAVASPHKFRVVFELRRMPQIDDFLPAMPEILQAPQSDSSTPSMDPNHGITQPPYPEDALAAGAEGDVILQFTVEADGFVDPNSIVVKKSSGFPSLDQAAVNEAAVNWRFRPATLNGQPVRAPHRFRVVFNIPERPAAD